MRSRNWSPVHGALLAALLLTVFLVGPARPASAQTAGVEITGVAVDGESVTVSLALLDALGNPAPGVAPGDLTVSVDGETVPLASLESATAAALPLALVLVVDTSGSMDGGPLDAARSALAPLVDGLQPQDRAALLAFAQSVETVVPLTGDKAALDAGIAGLTPVGNTALYDAVTSAVATAAAATEQRRAVVLLSDGEDFGGVSAATREQALATAAAGGVPFYVVGLGAEVDTAFLEALAGDAGEALFAAAPAELAGLYTRISERLRLEYTATLTLPAGLESGEHTLTVGAGGSQAATQFDYTAPVQPGATPPPTPASRPDPPEATLAGLESPLSEPATVTVPGAPQGSAVTFLLDGSRIAAGADGRSVLLDPIDLSPSGEHTFEASYVDGDVLVNIHETFEVAPIPPRILGPAELTGLGAGDIVRLEVGAQPGTLTATFLLDGVEAATDSEPPFEFTVPRDQLDAGEHQLSVVLEGESGRTTQQYTVDIPGGGSNTAIIVVLTVAIVAALAAASFWAWLAIRAAIGRRARTPSSSPEALAALDTVMAGRPERTAAPVAATAAPERPPWATLTVLGGRDAGREFTLRDDVELVGRGKSCTVRLRDQSVASEHFIVMRDGRFFASTPETKLQHNEQPTMRGTLTPGDTLRAGNTTLRFAKPNSP